MTRVQGLTLSVAEIIGRPGEYRDVVITEPLRDVRTALARLGDEPVTCTLRLESVIEGVLVTGEVRGPAVFQCARCLREFPAEATQQVIELFVMPGRDAPATEDAYPVKGLEIDLEPMLRDVVTLALPLKPLCRPECRGLCPRCGQDLNAGPCGCGDDDTDPRWAALDEIRARLDAR